MNKTNEIIATIVGKERKEVSLALGQPYLVKYLGGKTSVRRLFKGVEKRFGSIPCLVFTSKVSTNIRMTVEEDEKYKTFSYTKEGEGKGLFPSKELSLPYYDVVSIKPAK